MNYHMVPDDMSTATPLCCISGGRGGDCDDTGLMCSTTMNSSNDEVNFVPQKEGSAAWFSNLLFLAGSCLYVWLALWDIRLEKYWALADDDDPTVPVWLSPYMMISAAAASCYVVDASLQIFRSSPEDTTRVDGISSRRSESNNNHNHLLHRLQSSCFAALFVGLTFGLGAILDLISALTSTMDDQRLTNWTAVGAAHSYLVNAILLLAGKKASFLTLSESVEVFGDGLFLVGSLVDVSLSYFYIGEETDSVWKYVYQGNLLTAMLWLVDALLYIVADVFAVKKQDEQHASSSSNDDDVEEAETMNGDAHIVPLFQSSSCSLVEDRSDSGFNKPSISMMNYTTISSAMEAL